MKLRTRIKYNRRSAYAMVTVLVFLTVLSTLIAGLGVFVTSQNQRATVDSRYAAALDLAEAAVNYEFRKISNNANTADQAANPFTATLGSGTFSAYCTDRNGNAWTNTNNPLYVIGSGTVAGVTRTVKAAAKGYYLPGNYAIYTMEGTSVFNGSAIDIYGDMGSNGLLDFNGSPAIHGGAIYFDGPNAGWNGGVPTGYNVIYQSKPIMFPTVEEEAFRLFPNSGATAPGGLTYLATHNDNAAAGIVGDSITSSMTLGPGNYYLTNINLTGNDVLNFNNTNGPVNIWIGPPRGVGTARFRGGTAAMSMSTSPNVHIYVATTTGIDLAGNEQIDASINAYNRDALGEWGYVDNSGFPVIYGQIIANHMDVSGNVDVHWIDGLNQQTTYGYYGYDNMWLELNPR
jgi:Tfp pilus assembly protein PilX